ncbi:MAG: Kazal-type serine protease inhibitor [Thermodesulfobacteriota bacterium]
MIKNISKGAAVLLIITFAAALSAAGCRDIKKMYKEGSPCGGPEGTVCPDGLWCDLGTGDCGEENMAGVCVDLQKLCDGKFELVCGCDGRVYGNDCMRIDAGVRKAHDGRCGE